MTTVEQIVYTGHPERWHALAEALGFAAAAPTTAEWAEFHGDGVLAVHSATDDRPAGTVDLHLLTADLEDAAAALAPFGVAREHMAGVGQLLRVTTGNGVSVTVSTGPQVSTCPQVSIGGVAVQPIWFAEELDEPQRILVALGMRARIVGDRGGWVDLVAPRGGSVGLHAVATAESANGPSIGLSFLAQGDLAELAARVRDAGFDAAVIDEAYGRTLRFPGPDGDEIWINAEQDDLHGYHRADS